MCYNVFRREVIPCGLTGSVCQHSPNEKLYDMYAAMKSPAGAELSEAQRDEILKVIRIRNNNERK